MKITCRICKIQQGEFFTLDSEITVNDVKVKLLDIFNKLLPSVEANLKDLLPQVLCSECLVTLKLFYQFLLKAIRSNEELKYESMKNDEGVLFDYVPSTCVNESNKSDDTAQEREEEYEVINESDTFFEPYDKEECAETIESQYSQRTVSYSESDINKDNNAAEDFSLGEESDESANYIFTKTAVEISRHEDTSIQRIRSFKYEPLKETRKFTCLECGRKYSTELKLEQHRQLHTLRQESQCQICDAVFCSAFEYSEHLKNVHVIGERKYECEFCDKAFMSLASLHSHLLTHYKIKPFKCELCGKEFRQKSILKTHMTLHTGKPIECNICDKRFSRTAYLNVHMRQHNNIRPYNCGHCPNNYMQKSHLDRHVASSHMGVRHQCSLCERVYTKKSTLNTHMREEHTGGTIYACEVCEKDFTKQKSLYCHLRSKHPEYNRTNKNTQ